MDAHVGADFLRGEAKNDDLSLSAQEIGVSIGLRLKELEDRLHLDVDYRGREAVGGDVQNNSLRLLYEAEIGYAVVDDTFTVSLGRFVPDAPLFVPTDGLRLDLSFSGVEVSAFGGRRAITSGRRNVAVDHFLPSAGGSVRYRSKTFYVSLDGAFARDQVSLLTQNDDERIREFDAVGLMAHGAVRPTDDLLLGGSVSLAQRATYVLGPAWNGVELRTEALNLVNGLWFADWRILEMLRVAYQGHFQRTAIFRKGIIGEDDPIQDPNFFDNQVTVSAAPFELGWVRAHFRFRLRNDRREIRYGLSVEANELGIDGPYLLGRILFEDLSLDDGKNLDRLLWKAAAGFRRFGIDAQAGVSFLERTAAPVSGLAFDPRNPGNPVDPTDLSPFVLEARKVFFFRLFYSGEFWFAGADVERNLDGEEVRFLLQAGALWGAAW